MLGDIKDKRVIVVKAILFVVIGLMAATLLWLDHPDWRTAGIIAVCVWAFCRAYYFAVYVITNYLDPEYRYSGLLSALRHLCCRPRRKAD
jgi:hypothetical protein